MKRAKFIFQIASLFSLNFIETYFLNRKFLSLSLRSIFLVLFLPFLWCSFFMPFFAHFLPQDGSTTTETASASTVSKFLSLNISFLLKNIIPTTYLISCLQMHYSPLFLHYFYYIEAKRRIARKTKIILFVP